MFSQIAAGFLGLLTSQWCGPLDRHFGRAGDAGVSLCGCSCRAGGPGMISCHARNDNT